MDKTQRAEFDSVASVDYGAGASRITAHKCRLIAISKCSISVFIIARTVIDGAQTDCMLPRFRMDYCTTSSQNKTKRQASHHSVDIHADILIGSVYIMIKASICLPTDHDFNDAPFST